MKWNDLKKRIRFYTQYLPVTINTVIVALASWMTISLIVPEKINNDGDGGSFRPLILLLGKTALWFVVALIALSLLTTVLCWLYYLWTRRRDKNGLEFGFSEVKSGKGIWLTTLLKNVRRPFLGFVKGRLFYEDLTMTDKFILASNQRRAGHFWRDAISGKSRLILPDIKEYTVDGGFVYFEDMLQIISLPVRQRMRGHLYQPPGSGPVEETQAFPRKTEQTDVRIEQLRKVEGEYLNYKNFEGGDDVRRIVWKVYAKNRDLVVRIPEIFDPYASHIYFYASFHSGIKTAISENAFGDEMLNRYKNTVWSIFETFAGKEFEIKFIPDQHTIISNSSSQQQIQRIISNSNWQKEKPLNAYFEPRYGAILVISSFNDPADIDEMLSQCSTDTVIYFVKLSNTFKNFYPLAWLSRIFLKPPQDRLKRIRSQWVLTPFRYQLLRREKDISKILEHHDINLQII